MSEELKQTFVLLAEGMWLVSSWQPEHQAGDGHFLSEVQRCPCCPSWKPELRGFVRLVALPCSDLRSIPLPSSGFSSSLSLPLLSSAAAAWREQQISLRRAASCPRGTPAKAGSRAKGSWPTACGWHWRWGSDFANGQARLGGLDFGHLLGPTSDLGRGQGSADTGNPLPRRAGNVALPCHARFGARLPPPPTSATFALQRWPREHQARPSTQLGGPAAGRRRRRTQRAQLLLLPPTSRRRRRTQAGGPREDPQWPREGRRLPRSAWRRPRRWLAGWLGLPPPDPRQSRPNVALNSPTPCEAPPLAPGSRSAPSPGGGGMPRGELPWQPLHYLVPSQASRAGSVGGGWSTRRDVPAATAGPPL